MLHIGYTGVICTVQIDDCQLKETIQFTITVFIRIDTAATINFSAVQVWLLIEGGSYLRTATTIIFIVCPTFDSASLPRRQTLRITSWFSSQGTVSMRICRNVYDLSASSSARANYQAESKLLLFFASDIAL